MRIHPVLWVPQLLHRDDRPDHLRKHAVGVLRFGLRCQPGVQPSPTGYANGSAIDPEVGVFSHELIETMTDPNLNAWDDSSGNEIGDKCAYIYGQRRLRLERPGLANNGPGILEYATERRRVPHAAGVLQLQLQRDDTGCADRLRHTTNLRGHHQSEHFRSTDRQRPSRPKSPILMASTAWCGSSATAPPPPSMRQQHHHPHLCDCRVRKPSP